MTSHLETIELEDGIAQLRLTRAPVNALNAGFLGNIADALTDLESSVAVRAVVLTGTGNVFSAGMDLKEAIGFNRRQQTEMVDALNGCYATTYEFSKPLIAAANGHAIAGGLFFVLAADYRVVSESAMLGLTEVRAGVSFPAVANAMACHELGPSGARRIMLSGNNMKAAEAKMLGFVDAVVPAPDVAAAALEAARRYAVLPPQAFAAIKAQIRNDVVSAYRNALAAGDPARDGWFSDESHTAAKALLATATSKTSG